MTKYIVKYAIYDYENPSNRFQEESFDSLRLANKRRKRINRYFDFVLRDPAYGSASHADRVSRYHQAMTDGTSFHFLTKAKLFSRVTLEEELP